MQPRAAVVGAGLMGRWHAHAAARLGIRVAAVVDSDPRAAERLAAKAHPAARAFDDLSACLADCDLDVVHVCTPPGTHGPLVLAAVEAHRHVLVEKPLAPSTAETEELLDAARRARVSLNPVHQFPFQRGVRRLSERLAELGELVTVGYRTSSAGGAGRSPEDRHALLREIVPHAASLFHRFAPGFEPQQLEVVAQQEELGVFGRHGSTYLEAFITLRGRPPRNELQLVGTRASAVADLFHGYSIVDRGGEGGRGKAVRPFALGSRLLGGAAANGARRVARVEPAYPGLRELIADFYASVAAGAPPPIDEREIVAAAVLADAVPG